jgi:YidC/Oxa1 family membrane protein insertase
MKMTTGDQQMAQPQQEGMPDMAKNDENHDLCFPLMMLFF